MQFHKVLETHFSRA